MIGAYGAEDLSVHVVHEDLSTGATPQFSAEVEFRKRSNYALLAEHLRPKKKIHPFDVICRAHNIEHRLTKFRHPWTNGQVEVANRIIKKYTTKSYFYEILDELKSHMMTFILYYNRPLSKLYFR